MLGYPKGSASELLDGTLKLRHCTTIFTMRFPPRSLPSVGNSGGKRWDVTPGHPSDDGRQQCEGGPANQEDTSRCIFSQYSRSWGTRRRGDGQDCASLPQKERE